MQTESGKQIYVLWRQEFSTTSCEPPIELCEYTDSEQEKDAWLELSGVWVEYGATLIPKLKEI